MRLPLAVVLCLIGMPSLHAEDQRLVELNASTATLVAAGKYTEALNLAAQSTARLEKDAGPASPLVAQALVCRARLCGYQGKLEEQLALYERALNIFEKSPQAFPAELGRCLNDLAVLNSLTENFAAAEPLFLRLKVLAEAGQVPGLTGPMVEENLARMKSAQADRLAAQNAPPAEINGRKADARLNTVLRFATIPSQAAELLISKGAQRLDASGSACLLKWQGVTWSIASPELAAQTLTGHTFADGDTLYEYLFKTAGERAAFLARHGLKDTFTLTHARQGSRIVHKAQAGVFVAAVVCVSFYTCSVPECKGSALRHEREGLCPVCQRRLIWSSIAE